MEVNLQFEAHALERDLHFITELPLMSAITQSHGAQSQSESADRSTKRGIIGYKPTFA